ncbi:MAG: secondary thiamine-phosphate synthase enzyme YjbQ [Planctomycetota bacterium]
MVHSSRIQVATRGNTHVLDITEDVARAVQAAGVQDGVAVVFVIGSTAGITTTEAEPGLLTHDLKAFFERIAPAHEYYKHEATWGDDNGHAHVRASALGPSLTVPVSAGRLTLGTWQQIVLIDFDTRGRRREVVIQVLGE